MTKLRAWYEALLKRGEEQGIITEVNDIHAALEHLTSIKEFPLFYGDFFPDEMGRILKKSQPATDGPPTLVRESSVTVVKKMQRVMKDKRKRFLVAKLNPNMRSSDDGAAEVQNDLIDSRSVFLQRCMNRHWQFNELRRAQYATMMMLAELGGPA